MNIQEWVDTMLVYQFVATGDIWCKNTLYTSWDSIVDIQNNTVSGHWSPLMYDFDIAFGVDNPNIDVNAAKAYTYCPWLRPLYTVLNSRMQERYRELRNEKVFDYNNIRNLINTRTMQIGTDAYNRDVERWQYPSIITDNPPESVSRIMTLIQGRITYLDGLFNYSQN